MGCHNSAVSCACYLALRHSSELAEDMFAIDQVRDRNGFEWASPGCLSVGPLSSRPSPVGKLYRCERLNFPANALTGRAKPLLSFDLYRVPRLFQKVSPMRPRTNRIDRSLRHDSSYLALRNIDFFLTRRSQILSKPAGARADVSRVGS